MGSEYLYYYICFAGELFSRADGHADRSGLRTPWAQGAMLDFARFAGREQGEQGRPQTLLW